MSALTGTQVAPGVWRMRIGAPGAISPQTLRTGPAVTAPMSHADPPAVLTEIDAGSNTRGGWLLSAPLGSGERVYGLGLQLGSLQQRGRKKLLRVNSDPTADLGDSHAPVPFLASTAGYALWVDTLRPVTVYLDCARRRGDGTRLYVDAPNCPGVDVYLFAGPSMRDAVARYNLYAGGGCVPPLWGLGVWYRCDWHFDSEHVLALAQQLRHDRMPCDVIGLEPGWQTRSYSCSHVWSDSFPHPEWLTENLSAMGMRLNLWTHVFTHPDSPLYASLEPLSGDCVVWNGLLPDLTLPEARELLADHLLKAHIGVGVSGYKLDECDSSDYLVSPWSFPDFSRFPSGLDGEQMHTALGMLLQQTVMQAFQKANKRTYGLVRSSGALAAPMPFVLYSDLYDHRTFIRGIASASTSGLLWTPEVRHAESAEDLIRRIESAVLSPMALINGWYIQMPPWKQWDTERNNRRELAPDHEELTEYCRELFLLRMRLIPYLHAAFMEYYLTGIPPFRALAFDYPNCPDLAEVDDQFLIGDRMMAAPVLAGAPERTVAFPPGNWRDYWTGGLIEGGRSISLRAPLGQPLLFVRDGCLLPLAHPVLHAGDPLLYHLTVRRYGQAAEPVTLYEEDHSSWSYLQGAFNTVTLRLGERNEPLMEREGSCLAMKYRVTRVEIFA